MSRATYFLQDCPTCGRQLHVRVEYLGRLLVCDHCRGRFQATDPDSRLAPPPVTGSALMDKVDQLLATAPEPPGRPR